MKQTAKLPSNITAFTKYAENRIQKRSHVVAFRVSEADYQLLAAAAARKGKTVGNLVSSIAFSITGEYQKCESCKKGRF